MKRAVGLAMAVLCIAVAAAAQTVGRPQLYDAQGPEAVKSDPGGPTCTIFRPTELGATPRPVILWGNGTGTQPVNYLGILQRLASNGFVVAAANTPNAGSGQEMLACLDWLTAENAREGAKLYQKLDLSRVGATGHSQGGGGALMAGRDARIKTIAPIMPAAAGPRLEAVGEQHGPILVLSGSADVMTPPERTQQPVFEQAKTPVIWATLTGAGHLTPMQGGGPYPGIVAAWFRWRLMDDAKAGALFQGEDCAYCRGGWTLRRKGGV